jgi:hypothetical protein
MSPVWYLCVDCNTVLKIIQNALKEVVLLIEEKEIRKVKNTET